MNNKYLPAYPVSEYDIHTFGHKTVSETAAFVKGLTKLEAFAKAFGAGLCANPTTATWSEEDFAYRAVRIAEAVLAELDATSQPTPAGTTESRPPASGLRLGD